MAETLPVVLRFPIAEESKPQQDNPERDQSQALDRANANRRRGPAGRLPCLQGRELPGRGRIQIHGHGLRERQVRGPLGPGEKAAAIGVPGRRYRCVVCDSVFLVVPREVLPRRQYSAAAIGFALALWGLVGLTAIAVRLQISPSKVLGFDAMTGWVTLRRWAKAVKTRCLFPSVPAAGPSATLRDVAALAATALAASADPTTRHLPLEQRAFLGAAHAA